MHGPARTDNLAAPKTRRAIAALVLLCCCARANGGDGAWSLPGDGPWNDPASWSGAVPNAPGDTALFDTHQPVADATVDLADLGATIGSLEDSNPYRLVIIGSGPLKFDVPGTGGTATIELGKGAGNLQIVVPVLLADDDLIASVLDEASTLQIDGAISGAGSIEVDQGFAVLSGANTFTGVLRAEGGTVSVRGLSAHGGSNVGPGGQLLVAQSGSLVDAGLITVVDGGELRIREPAGTDPQQNSVPPQGVVLAGGMVTLDRNDCDPASLLAPTSTGGVLALERLSTFTAGGSNLLDFDAVGGTAVRLGAKTDSTIPASVALVPESSNRTLRFGGAPGTLTLEASISDIAGQATHIEQAGGGTTVLAAANTYSGTTTVVDGTLVAGHNDALAESDTVRVGADATLRIRPEHVVTVKQLQMFGGRLTGGGSGTATVNGPIVLFSDSILANLDSDATLRIDGAIGGAGGVIVDLGMVDLLGANTFAGALQLDEAEVHIHGHSAHGESIVGAGSRLVVDDTGSLVSAGQVTVHSGGELRVVKPAGTNQDLNSVAPRSVLLDGGMVMLADDFDPTNLLASISNDGVLALENVPIFTAGGRNVLDFSAIGGTATRLGAITESTLPADLALLPESSTGTLRFGGAPGELRVAASIVDVAGQPTHLAQTGIGTTALVAANTYTGTTTVSYGNLVLAHPEALGASAEVTIDGGTLEIAHSGAAATRLNRVVLRNNGSITQSVDATGLEAAELLVESGTIRARLTGTGAPLKSTSGRVTLSGDNDYTGVTRITEGALAISHANALGSGSGTDADATQIDPMGTLELHDGVDITGEKILLNGGTILAEETTWPSTLGGTIELLAGGAIGQFGDDYFFRPTDLNGLISGVGDLTLTGELRMTSDNSYTGSTFVRGLGTEVLVKSPFALGAPEADTTVTDSGTLCLRTVVAEPLVVDGGTVCWQEGSEAHTSPVTLRRGTLAFADVGNIAFAVELGKDPSVSGEASLRGDGETSWEGEVYGHGDLALHGALRIDGALNHDGNLSVDTRREVTLNSANEYTGTTRIHRGNVFVNHPQAFGVSTTPISIENNTTVRDEVATLRLQTVIDRDIDIVEGDVFINDTSRPYTGTIRLWNGKVGAPGATIDGDVVLAAGADSQVGLTLSNGSWNGNIRGHGQLSLYGSSTIAINGNNTYRGITTIGGDRIALNSPTALGSDADGSVFDTGTTELNASMSEPLLVQDRGHVRLNAQLGRLPSFNDLSGGGTVEITSPSHYDQHLDLTQGTLQVSADTELGAVLLRDGGGLVIADGVQATTQANTLLMRGGLLQGNIGGVEQIRKLTSDTGEIRNLTAFTGQILVEQGTLVLDNVAGSGAVTLGGARGAVVKIESPLEYHEVDLDFDLNNGIALDDGPAFGGRGIVRGEVDLGDDRAYVGGANTSLFLDGPIIGGSLVTPAHSGNCELIITNDENTFIGETVVRSCRLELAHDGTLTTPSGVVLGAGGELSLNNSTWRLPGQPVTISNDRIGDAVPVTMRGGSLGLRTPASHVGTEIIGSMVADRGSSFLFGSGVLTVGSLARERGATLEINKEGQLVVRLDDPPILNDGLIGNWLTVWHRPSPSQSKQCDFATYGPAGIVPLTEFETNIAAATANDNVLLGRNTGPLSRDTVVNSLTIDQPPEYPGDRFAVLNLGGHALTVESGGIVLRGGGISNGQLSVGTEAANELVVHGLGAIDADITDQDGPLTVILAAPTQSSHRIHLGGNNSYSGPTIVNGRATSLVVDGPAALPDDSDLVVNGGEVWLDYAAAEPKQLGTLTLRDNGALTRQGIFDFDILQLEDGTIEEITLAGDGAIRKTTDGTVVIDTRNPDFAGTVDVFAGTLEVRECSSLGVAPVTLHGGVIRYADGRPYPSCAVATVTLNGGALAVTDQFEGPIVVTAPSTVIGAGGSALGESATIRGTAPLTLTTTSGSLAVDSDNGAYAGDMFIDGTVIARHPRALGTGRITVNPAGVLDTSAFSGNFPNDVVLAGGTLSTTRHANVTHLDIVLTGSVFVQADSFLRSRYQGAIVIAEQLYLDDSVRLTKTGEGLLHIAGDLRVGHGTQIVTGPGFFRHDEDGVVRDFISEVHITGTIIANASHASVDFIRSGFDTLVFEASVEVPTGQTLGIAEDGALMPLTLSGPDTFLTGNGLLENAVELRDGAFLEPGDSTGTLHVAEDFTFGSAGIYRWEINDALGSAGATAGWDQLVVAQTLHVTATEDAPFVIELHGIGADGEPGPVASFDPSAKYEWILASAGTITGFAASLFELDVSRFTSNNAIPPTARFNLEQRGGGLNLVYVVPEPSSLVLWVGLAVLMLLPKRRARVD